MIANSEKELLADAMRAELARRRLIDFALATIPGFEAPRHLVYLADILERVERGERKWVIVTLHPGAGKSTLMSAFVGWYIGRDPTRKVITVSGGAELAERNSRMTRSLFSEPGWPFEARLSQDTRSMTRWNTEEGGGLFAIGTEGKITGWRGAIVADDIQNDYGTQGERDSLWKFWTEVLFQRREPGAPIILCATRWGSDDLIGRILDSEHGKDWHVVRMPAIAEKDDQLGRKIGEPLWPERWPLDELTTQKLAMGSRTFECVYQANPINPDGNLIKGQWLQRYDKPPAEFERVVCALDAAAKTGVRNDYSAIVKIGVTKNAFYVLDVWRAKVEFPALVWRVKALMDEPLPPSVIYAEDTSNAIAMNQTLRQETRLPIVPVQVKGSQEGRVEATVAATAEAKRLFLPNEAPWLLDFERELLSYPSAKNDDQVCALSIALTKLRTPRSEVYWAIGRNAPVPMRRIY